MKVTEFLFKLGATLWFVLLCLGVVVLILKALGWGLVQHFDWVLFTTVLGVGGLLAFAFAGVLSIWQR